MSSHVAELGIRIFLDDTASSGLNAMNGVLGHMGHIISSTAYTWTQLGSEVRLAAEMTAGAGVAFLGFSSVLEESTDAAAELQDTMAFVSIAFNASEEETRVLTSSVETLASRSRFSSDQVGQAFITIGERGFTAEDAMDHVGAAAIRLAEATRSQVTPATELLSSTMQIFEMDASRATEASDALTFAFYHGMPSTSQLSQMISEVGYECKVTGVSLEQLVVTMDYLTRSGVPASQAANSLRYMLSSLSNPTTKASEELANMGIILVNQTSPALQQFLSDLDAAGGMSNPFDGTVRSLNSLFNEALKLGTIHTDESFFQWATASGMLSNQLYDSSGKMHDLFTMIKQLGTALDGLNPEQKTQALNQLFTVRGGKDASILLENINTTTEALDKLDNQYKKFSGGAALDALKVTSTYNGQMDMLKTTIISFLATSALPFVTFLGSVAGQINALIAPLANIQGEFVKFFGLFILVGTLVSAATLIGGFVTLLVLFWGTFGPIIIVVGLTAAGIVALSLAISFVIAYWNQLQPVLRVVYDSLMFVVGALVVLGLAFAGVSITQFLAGLWALMPALSTFASILFGQTIPALLYQIRLEATIVAQNLIWAVQNLSTIIPGLLAQAGAALVAAGAWILLNLPLILLIATVALLTAGFVYFLTQIDAGRAIVALLSVAWGVIVKEFQNAVATVMPALRNAVTQLQPVWKQLVDALNQARPALMFLGAIVGGILVVAFGLLIGLVVGLIRGLAALLVAVIGVAAGFIRSLMGVVQFWTGFFNLIIALIRGDWPKVGAAFLQMGQGIKNIFGGIWDSVKAVFVGAFSVLYGIISGFIGGVIGFFRHLFDVLVGHSIVPDMVIAIIALFVLLPLRVLLAILSLIPGVGGFFAALSANLTFIVSNLISTIVYSFFGLPGAIIGAMGNLGGMLWGFAQNAMNMFLQPIYNAINGVRNAVGGIAGTIRNILGFQSPPKEGPLADSHTYMPNMLKMYSDGIVSHQHLLKSATTSIATALHPTSFTTPGIQSAQATSANAAGGSTYILKLDGDVVASFTENRLLGTLQMNGLNRLMR